MAKELGESVCPINKKSVITAQIRTQLCVCILVVWIWLSHYIVKVMSFRGILAMSDLKS